MGSSKLNRETLKKFAELLNVIELFDFLTESQSFKRRSWNILKDLKVEISSSSEILNLEDIGRTIETKTFFDVLLKDDEKEIMRFSSTYLIIFTNKDPDKVKELLTDKNVKELFLDKQLPKIAWSFLRSDYNLALAKVGIRPITLPLLK